MASALFIFYEKAPFLTEAHIMIMKYEPYRKELNMDQVNQANQCGPQPRQTECSWQTPGMAYVPWQQFTRAYEPKRALQAGTIFPELDKPFTGKCIMRQGGRRCR